MQTEQRIQRPSRPRVSFCLRHSKDALAPQQIHTPDVPDKRLHIDGPANAALKLKQRRVGVKMAFPKAG
jgi:hypothetical protein